MLCDVCVGMLSRSEGLIKIYTLEYTFEHHKSSRTLQAARDMHCPICTRLAKTLDLDTDDSQDQPLSIQATLNWERLYSNETGKRTFRLDFELGDNRECTFFLAETDEEEPFNIRSHTLEDITETAQIWMNKCKCAKSWEEPDTKWYPHRLLDLQELRANLQNPQRAKLILTETKEYLSQPETYNLFHYARGKHQNDRYVTLSHCWGKPKPDSPPPLRMTSENEERFKADGILWKELPKTFQDAVIFAAGLEKVGFIWIDSLCIRQPIKANGMNQEEQFKDWLEQSRHMGTVYRKAFLNISATAGKDGQDSLFFSRRPEHLWANNVYVHYPEDHSIEPNDDTPRPETHTRCSLIDTSTWDDLVEYAPVNRRAWVFQERLLAPRVLHFGYNQLAWECHEFSCSESHTPSELAIKPSRANGFVQEGCLKHLTASAGRSFREARLNGFLDPDQHIKDIYIYELWKKTVESYSRTQLTEHKDKLIAFGGIAKLFQDELFSTDSERRYVAGLWSRHIEGQLLWRVNEVYCGNGIYDNPGTRHPESGPSWTWAAIDTPHGVTYGDITDYQSSEHSLADLTEELLFLVTDHSITLADPKNPFGMVTSGHIFLAPRYFHPIELQRQTAGRGVPYTWRLKSVSHGKRQHTYANIYLDAPASDTDIFGDSAQLYCMPGAYGERTVRSADRYLYCLLLKFEGDVSILPGERDQREHQYRSFRRVGITKVGGMFRTAQEALKQGETQEVICVC